MAHYSDAHSCYLGLDGLHSYISPWSTHAANHPRSQRIDLQPPERVSMNLSEGKGPEAQFGWVAEEVMSNNQSQYALQLKSKFHFIVSQHFQSSRG